MGIDLVTRRLSHSLSKLVEGTSQRFADAVNKANGDGYTIDDLKLQMTGAMLQTFDVWMSSFYFMRSPGPPPLDRRQETVATMNTSGGTVTGTVVLEKPLPTGSVLNGPSLAKVGDPTKVITGGGATLGHDLNDEVTWTATKALSDPPAVAGVYRGEIKIGPTDVIARVQLKLS